MNTNALPNGPDVNESIPNEISTDESEVHAWEEIESGRYMPRRIRGSCKGRSLG